MLAIEFAFPGWRYHANPWGRHVNEADVGWPPDPWRITRALIATWHRKLDPLRFPRSQLEALLTSLAADAPGYRLPEAVHNHTRHYMPVVEGTQEKKTLIFDAFVRVDEPLIAVWPNTVLSREQTQLLDALLDALGYLGRAESWVEARRLDAWTGELNSLPGDEAVDPQTGELREVITLYAPRTPAQYAALRQHALAGAPDMKKADRARLLATLPDRWLDALAVDTAQLQAAGWSAPPAAERRHYVRPAPNLVPAAIRRTAPAQTHTRSPTTARFALYGKPLPRLEDALRVGEWARMAVLGRAKWTLGEARIPPVLSGHALPDDNRHGHAFYLLEDADGDWRIDHLLVHAAAGFDTDAVRVLADLTWLKDDNGQKLQLLLEGLGSADQFRPLADTCATSTVWESVTPYLHPWHRKKRFGVYEQLRRECRERGLAAELISASPLATDRRAVEFARFRRKRGLTQPDTLGGFWRLEFDRPVSGPLALGFACHFGLGLFRAGTPQTPSQVEGAPA